MSGLSVSARRLAGATGAFLALYGALAARLLGRGDSGLGIAAASVVLAGALAALSAIDVYLYRLPDALTLPLAALGLVVAYGTGAMPVWWAAVSAGLGYVVLAGLAYAYAYVRGRPGLGLGDAKLVAAAGAWLGAEALPALLLWATGAALACVLVATWRGRPLTGASRLPFGPFLAFGFWLVWLYGPL